MAGDGKDLKLGKDLSGFTVTGKLVETRKGDKVDRVQEAPPQHLSPPPRPSPEREPRADHRARRGKEKKE